VIFRLHHVGMVVQDISRTASIYVQRYGYEIRTEIIHDPTQTAYVQFLRLPGETVYLELVSPDSANSKVSGALARGGGLNHLCYLTDDIGAAWRDLQSKRLMLLQMPVLATAFPGRRIAWMIGDDRTPIELLEAGGPDDL
jgi:methylmalonyl-CoA/ethylmalonyl-CoA epimerase